MKAYRGSPVFHNYEENGLQRRMTHELQVRFVVFSPSPSHS